MDQLNKTVGNILNLIKETLQADVTSGAEFSVGEFSCMPFVQVKPNQISDQVSKVVDPYFAGSDRTEAPLGFLITGGAYLQFVSSNRRIDVSVNNFLQQNHLAAGYSGPGQI